jgi:tetracycline 7-halogenase / FADH2 O2-dependent halogenase
MTSRFEFGVIGSGFSGSLLAWILARRGHSVVLVDRTPHPRFAVGESSTPLADLLLEVIADRYDLTQLRSLSRWGSWQLQVPQLRAGKKRGFSYYNHDLSQKFYESPRHENSLLVAASSGDELSDTHWMRSDVDHWICDQAIAAGVTLIDRFDSAKLQVSAGDWKLQGQVDQRPMRLDVGTIIDASGSGATLAQALQLKPLSEVLLTRTASVFGHFRNVGRMSQWLVDNRLSIMDDPFDGDDAAQHHWLGKGWLWMLRFSEGTTSVGLTLPCRDMPIAFSDARQRQALWMDFLQQFPTLADLLGDSQLVDPVDFSGHPQLHYIPRISRLWPQAAGLNWLMLPSTAGIVDPLHSTGIAHSLSGVLRVADILTGNYSALRREELFAQYSADIVGEIKWIDQLVHICYAAGSRNFAGLVAACSLYFIAAIHAERQLAETGMLRDGFLLARNTPVQHVVHSATTQMCSVNFDAQSFVDWLRVQIQPWNDVGLLDDRLRNRLSRSVALKSLSKKGI